MGEDLMMMSESEVQLVIYVEDVLRRRGYSDLANNLTGIIDNEVDRRARLMSPADTRLRATG